MTTTPFSWREFEAEASDPANHRKPGLCGAQASIADEFTPVPRQRARRNGCRARPRAAKWYACPSL